MSSTHVHSAGINLERIVSRLGAKLAGPRPDNNSADYYDYGKGLFDGIASCLETMESEEAYQFRTTVKGSPAARYGVGIKEAIRMLRAADESVRAADEEDRSVPEDPDNLSNLSGALVAILGAFEAIHQHTKGNDIP